MRKLKLYTKLFLPFTLCGFFLPSNLDNFKSSLVATALGIGLTISFAEALRQLGDHKRRKKTAGLLKLITIPYLENQCLNFKENSKLYKDMGELEHARAFLLIVENYHRISADFDKQWLQLIYSPSFIDTIDADERFNAIGHAVAEVLIFTKTITAHSLSASRLLDLIKRSEAEKTMNADRALMIITQARAIRDSIDESVEKLVKYTDELDREINALLTKTGATYELIER